MMLLSIVIPLYNEETVGKILDKVSEAGLSMEREIIIVNDGSTDRSREMAEAWIAAHPEVNISLYNKSNGGKGSAVREGIIRSKGDIVLIQDADLEYDPNDFQACVNPFLHDGAQVVYGSRELGGRNAEHSHLSFYLGGIIVTAATNFLYGSALTDEATCYKVFNGKLIRTLLFEGSHFEWEPEITAKLLRLGFDIQEVPVRYYPRTVSEGKKIKWFDGLEALWTLLKYRFTPLNTERAKLKEIPEFQPAFQNRHRCALFFWGILLTAFVLRFLVTLPCLEHPERLLRPDSDSYIQTARSLLQNFTFSSMPGSEAAETARTPGYPLLLALGWLIGGIQTWIAPLLNTLLGCGAVVLTYAAARRFTTRPYALTAMFFAAANLTAVAVNPLILTDTFFHFAVALQLFLFCRFWKSGHFFSFLLTLGVAALACYIRPANLFWCFPAAVLLFIHPALKLKTKFRTFIISTALFIAILAPWMVRNALHDAGFTFSTISGSTLYYHNTAALESVITGIGEDEIRTEKQNRTAAFFAANPDSFRTVEQKNAYYCSESWTYIAKHPWTYLGLHFRPYILLPDLPALSEDFGYSLSGRGTFAVLNKDGILPAMRHYFQGQYEIVLAASPLLVLTALLYFLSAIWIIRALFRRDWATVILFGAFAYYYLFIPGPVAMPRYQLPALPLLTLFAVLELQRWIQPRKNELKSVSSDNAG